MSTPPITGWVPKVSANPTPAEIHRNLTLIFQKLANHASAFGIQQAKINSLKSGTVTKVFEGGSGGGYSSSSTALTVNNQSGVTSYATASGDNGALIVLSDASPIAVSLTGQAPPFGCFIANQGAGTATLTPALFGSSTPTISYAGHPGSASMPLLGGYGTLIGFDGSNWWALTMPIVPVTFSAISHQFLTAYDDATGSFAAAQPDFTDISGTATAAQVPALSALSGAITAAQLPANVPVVSFGSGAPSGASTEGYIYFDTSVSPYNSYVYHSGVWQQFA